MPRPGSDSKRRHGSGRLGLYIVALTEQRAGGGEAPVGVRGEKKAGPGRRRQKKQLAVIGGRKDGLFGFPWNAKPERAASGYCLLGRLAIMTHCDSPIPFIQLPADSTWVADPGFSIPRQPLIG